MPLSGSHSAGDGGHVADHNLIDAALAAKLDATTASGTYAPVDTARAASFPKARGAVCFTWDDGFASHYTVAQMATARSQRHTFFITTNLNNTGGYMTPAQLLDVSTWGHEIGAHGLDHIDMTAQTQANRILQYDNSKTAIEAIIGAGKCRSWAYPLGARNTTTDRELYLRYDRLLATSTLTGGVIPMGGVYHEDQQRSGHFLIMRMQWNGTAAQHANILAAIRQAAVSPIIVVIYSHSLDAGGAATTAQVTEAMNLVQTLGVPAVTLAEAFPAVPNLLDPGFEDPTLGSWQKVDSTGGTQVAESLADAAQAGLNGSRSLHLNCNGATSFVYAGQGVQAEPGKQYTLSGRWRIANIGTGAGAMYARITESDAFGNQLAQNSINTIAPAAWTSFATSVTLNVATVYVRIDFAIINLIADAYVDHVHWGLTARGAFGN